MDEVTAIRFMINAHGKQLDKNGNPYFFHPLGVARLAKKIGLSKDAYYAALLHDVLEDTALTVRDLIHEGFSNRTINLVLTLTKQAGLTYFENINRIAGTGDFEAIILKFLDNFHNLYIRTPLDKRHSSLTKRYEKAQTILISAIIGV